MKKVLALILSVLLCVGLFGCNTTPAETTAATEATEPDAGPLLVGYGREDITPDETVHLQGGDWKNRRSDGILDHVYVTCVAMKQGDQAFLLITMDLKLANNNIVQDVRPQIRRATGIPEANIIMAATHTHSSVAVRYDWDGVEQYKQFLYQQLLKAVDTAVNDLTEAQIYAGTTETERMTFVRHYLMNDGTYAGSNFGSWTSGIKGHARAADTELQMVKLAREGKKDILMLSFPTHGTFNESGLKISADFVSPMRDHVEANSDMLVAYFIGAAGDQVPSSRIQGEQYSKDYVEYGQRLGQYALDALDSLKAVDDNGIKTGIKTYTAPTNKKNLDKLADAQTVINIANTYGNSSAELKAALKQYGFDSRIEASWVISRAGQADTKLMMLNTLRVGNLAFAVAPYEMNGWHGKAIKDGSPYDMTFIITCAGQENYIASSESFDYNCYESQCCFYEQGTGEKLIDVYLEMLQNLK